MLGGHGRREGCSERSVEEIGVGEQLLDDEVLDGLVIALRRALAEGAVERQLENVRIGQQPPRRR